MPEKVTIPSVEVVESVLGAIAGAALMAAQQMGASGLYIKSVGKLLSEIDYSKPNSKERITALKAEAARIVEELKIELLRSSIATTN